MKRFKILGTGTAFPERVLTNAELEKTVDTSDAWIVERTGIRERRIADAETSTSTLGAASVRAACAQAGIEPDSLDAIILATSSPDTMFPSTACWVQHKLDIGGMAAFDIGAGCSGFLFALEVGASLLGTGKRVAVIGAEVMSKVVNWEDRSTCVLFGDGAATVIIESTDEERGLLSFNWGSDGRLAPILYQPAGGTQMPATAETVAQQLHSVKMQGNPVFKHAVRSMTAAGKAALAAAELSADDIDLLIPHQANMRIMEACRTRLKVPKDKMMSIVHKYGNMSAATIPVALHEAREQGRAPADSTIAMAAFGTGLTWAGAVLRV